jgi:hypothetical protein
MLKDGLAGAIDLLLVAAFFASSAAVALGAVPAMLAYLV